jgi:acetyl-CoA synthetase
VTGALDPLEPAWRPDPSTVAAANLSALIADRGLPGYPELHRWSVEHRAEFWGEVVERLGIVLRTPYRTVLDGSGGPEQPRWLVGAELNIVESCFTAPPERLAVVHRAGGAIQRVTYGELRQRVDAAASGLGRLGVGEGDRVAIAMPMTREAVVAYLAVVAVGGAVVSIADSFAPDEIAARLRADLVVTQDRITRAGRHLPMYDKVVDAGAQRAVAVDTGAGLRIRDTDLWWADVAESTVADGFDPVPGDPDRVTNVLFSSGTTGEPKAIPWTQLTPVKAAMDGHFHHDIHPGDVVAWPTNLGWMMGPWLIYASLVNGAALALHDDAPTGRDFANFVAEAGVTVLGVVPSLVAAWRSGGVLDPDADQPVDWTGLRLFSSTGEASNPDDMRWLMGVAGGKPVIEYCGGTEIGGGYITGTVLHDAVPSTFTTPALGWDLRLLDEDGAPADEGELFLVPPSMGMSTALLNRDHHEVYYAGLPAADVPLRRHGDHMERLPDGRFRALGRVDDTMNLGGIKVSSAEIERVVAGVLGVAEAAAVAVSPPGGGPSRLVVYVVPAPGAELDPDTVKPAMQAAIGTHLNPLFRIDRVVPVDALPRTASAKVMRRRLREIAP